MTADELFLLATLNCRREPLTLLEIAKEFGVPLDPLTEDDIAIDERADEAIREQRWNDFVAHLKAFQETEGVSGILAAMSRALREQAAER